MGYFQDQLSNESNEPPLDMWLVDHALEMTQGYVLDFSDKSFNDFVRRKFGIDATVPTYTVDGGSKAKRLRALLRSLVPGAQAEVLRVFWEYRQQLTKQGHHSTLEPKVEADFLQMIANLEGSYQPIDLAIVENFNGDQTLGELVDAIQRDIQANKPHAALDRLHTYAMKKFADLLARDGIDVTHNEALHARAGRYINNLRLSSQIGEYSAKIAKSAVQVMEQFNQVRNNQSLAHDNEMLSLAEGRYVFETVLSLLRFIKALDEAKFGR
ncbi:abortive infection family protein [Sphingomonas elodea]|uniref:abortive infection family protein n=2 Tax=Pseudomonadota TaxID=1224 RepID=UPI0002631653|nr:abortive infection family protein [Sphingomonas elodea]